MKSLVYLLFIALVAANTTYPITKYYDLVIVRCNMWEGAYQPPNWPPPINCNKTVPWAIGTVQPLLGYGEGYTLAKNCNLTRRDHINQTTILPYVKNIEAQLHKNWHCCGACDGSHEDDPIMWMLAWANGGCCGDWGLTEYFTNALLMFARAQGRNWYNCCGNQVSECHIPHTPDLQPIGCYWPAQGWGYNDEPAVVKKNANGKFK